MDVEKYNRTISLMCPICGNKEFETDSSLEEEQASIKCISCDTLFTKDTLIDQNNEDISEHVSEIKQEIIDDVTKKLKRMFQGK